LILEGIIVKRLTIAVMMIFAAALASSAAPLTVSWADGKVELQKGSSWAAVGMGDRVDSAATIRLGKGASVELSDGQRKVSLTAAGIYAIDSLLKRGAVASKRNSAALDKMGKLVDPRATVESSAVAAVRGEAIEPAKDSVTWQTDTVDVAAVMDEGRRLVRCGEFSDAALKFGEAASAAEGDEKDSAQYAQAWALAADDSAAQAVKVLKSMPDSGGWAGPRALLLARLDIDSGAKGEAATVLGAALDATLLAGDDVDLAKSLLAEASAK
jgi:hypothetical protein